MKELKNDLKETFAYMFNCFMAALWTVIALVIGVLDIVAKGAANLLDAMLNMPSRRAEEYTDKLL